MYYSKNFLKTKQNKMGFSRRCLVKGRAAGTLTSCEDDFAPGGWEVCGPLPKTVTLFMTKIWDTPYPINDLKA